MPKNQRNRRIDQVGKIFLTLSLFLISSCGVKGKPLPPTDPTFIGRGQPYIFTAPKPETEEEKKRKQLLNEK